MDQIKTVENYTKNSVKRYCIKNKKGIHPSLIPSASKNNENGFETVNGYQKINFVIPTLY